MEGKIDVDMRLKWTWKVSENASKIVSKSVENLRKSSFGAVLEHFGTLLAPRWPKMRVGSHLGLHSPRWPKFGQSDAKIAGQLGPQDGQLGSIWGGILAHFSDLERDLSKNSGSVKTTNPITLLVVF